MADTTNIEWTDATWNIVTGCSVLSPGCANCYAMKLAGTRLKHHPSRKGLTTKTKAGPVWNGKVRFNEQWLDQPLRWKRKRMIFVCAHGDLFHEDVPDEWLDQIFAVMALTVKTHTYQVLTKRAARMAAYFNGPWQQRVKALLNKIKPSSLWNGNVVTAEYALDAGPLPNVWLGVSVEDQTRADERIPHLLNTPAAVRWISAEPLLGSLDLCHVADDGDGYINALSSSTGPNLDWIVAGGESGPGARPMHPVWEESLRLQCAAAKVPYFRKQLGAWRQLSTESAVPTGKTHPTGRYVGMLHGGKTTWMEHVGKKVAGHLIDGVAHREFPQAAA